MLTIKQHKVAGYEQIVEAMDEASGLHSIIAIHNTTLGPALGGTRIYPYKTTDEALTDVLRLSKGMTYKSALAEIGLGGGKSVIIADPKKDKTEKLLLSFGELVETLKGQYICAEDVGSSCEDMKIISKKTHYVAALLDHGSSGDPSPFTSWGIFRGIEAVAQTLWHNRSVAGKTIAIQGLGKVGAHLAEILFWHGAHLIVSDIDKEKAEKIADLYGAKVVPVEEIYQVPCDIFSPCAMGGVINQCTIPLLRCEAIAGSANNQLLEPKHGRMLMENRILYAPDFVINAGGIINASIEFEPKGYNPESAKLKVDKIYDTLMCVFNRSRMLKEPTSEVANELAEHNLAVGIGKRLNPIALHYGELNKQTG